MEAVFDSFLSVLAPPISIIKNIFSTPRLKLKPPAAGGPSPPATAFLPPLPFSSSLLVSDDSQVAAAAAKSPVTSWSERTAIQSISRGVASGSEHGGGGDGGGGGYCSLPYSSIYVCVFGEEEMGIV